LSNLTRFGISIDDELLQSFDQLIEKASYQSRSEAIRDLIRNYLVQRQWEDSQGTVVGTITLVYDHHTTDIEHQLIHKQHEHIGQICASTHVHLDEHNCLEVIIVKGPAQMIRSLADHLIAQRGVKHGHLTCTTTGAALT